MNTWTRTFECAPENVDSCVWAETTRLNADRIEVANEGPVVLIGCSITALKKNVLVCCLFKRDR